MSMTLVAARGVRFWMTVATLATLAAFLSGVAVGGQSRAGERSSAGSAVVPARSLDTSRSYLTVQNGIVVPGHELAGGSTPAATLDTSNPYLTIQHGVVVAGRGTRPALDLSRPYLTVQDGIVVPGR